MPTTKILKLQINEDIKNYLKKYSVASMSTYNFDKFILPTYPSWFWTSFSVKLYKNGKTCQVKKKKSKEVIIPKFSFAPITSKDLIGDVDIWKSTKPPTTKTAKEAILEGKLSQLVKFHVERKHAYPWDTCVACKAIRAFIQWEFHQPWPNEKKKKITVEVGQLTKEGLESNVFYKKNKIVSPKPGDVYHNISDDDKQKGLNFLTKKDHDLLFKEESNLFDKENEDFDGPN